MKNTIDVHDLPEKDVMVIKGLVELLRSKSEKERENSVGKPEQKDKKIVLEQGPLGVKGTLSREEIYDYL